MRIKECLAALTDDEWKRLDEAQEAIELAFMQEFGVLNRPENWVVVAMQKLAIHIETIIDRRKC